MESFDRMEISFRKGGVCGFPVRDGIARRYSGLEGRDRKPFQSVGIADQVNLRIEVSA